MAKIAQDVFECIRAGYTAGSVSADGTRRATLQNPHYATSTYGDAWDLGWLFADRGLSIEGVEKGRGNTWRTAFGTVWRLVHRKTGGIYVERVV